MKHARTTRDELERVLVIVARSFKFWRRSLAVFVIGLAIAVPVVFTLPRKFRSETVVMYRETMGSNELLGREGAAESARRVGLRLKEFLMSRKNLEGIINEFELYAGVADSRGMVDAVDEMRKHVFFHAKEGDTFLIAFEGSEAGLVQRVAIRLGRSIVAEAERHRAEMAHRLKEFLSQKAERNAVELHKKEAELGNFISLHPEFALPQAGVDGAVAPKRAAASTPANRVLAALEARAARIAKRIAGDSEAASASSEALTPKPATARRESQELIDARKDLADKRARYTEKHPDVVAARARVKAAEAASEAPPPTPPTTEVVRQEPLTPAQIEALKRDLAALRSEIATRRASLEKAAPRPDQPSADPASTSVALGVEFKRLSREVTEARTRQGQLDDRQFSAEITVESVADDRNIQVSILDAAFRPSHAISTGRAVMLAMTALGLLCLAFAVALVSALLDDRIYDRVDLEVLDLVPVLGAIPGVPVGRGTTTGPPKVTSGAGTGRAAGGPTR